MTYNKQSDDKQFRVVNVAELGIGRFQDFSAERVDYHEGCVIEVLKSDGSTRIEYGRARQRIVVSISYQENCLYIPKFVPTARLWVCAKDDPTMYYKVPMTLRQRDDNVYTLIPGNPQNVKLVGDQYFDAVYELQ